VDRCDMLCTSGFADDVMFSHDGPCGASCICLSGENITADTTASIPIKFCLTMMISKYGNRTKSPLDKRSLDIRAMGLNVHRAHGVGRKVHPNDQYALAEILFM